MDFLMANGNVATSYYGAAIEIFGNGTTVPALTPTVTVTPSATSITTAQSLSVTVTVAGGGGDPVPTGSVTLTGGGYMSAATTLTSGGATITIPAGSLATGSDTLTVMYDPHYCRALVAKPSSWDFNVADWLRPRLQSMQMLVDGKSLGSVKSETQAIAFAAGAEKHAIEFK